MQLVAYGAQDIYLTGNPQITFFKVVYRRHTNFSMEAIQQTWNGTETGTGRCTATISRNGDLVGRMYLEVNGTPVSTKANPGSSWIKSVELEIGGQKIDKQSGHWMEAWAELTEVNPLGDCCTKLGNDGTLFQMMTGMGGWHADSGSGPTSNYYIPLQFWFCRNPGLALPLIALQYHEVKVILDHELDTYFGNSATNKLYADYIYLDTDERRRFAQVSHEYLIEQVQEDSWASAQTELNFNHPVKELVFYLQLNLVKGVVGTSAHVPMTGPIQLKLNGHDRFSERDAKYFTRTQVWQHHSGPGGLNSITASKAMGDSIGVYSFALKPEEHQPSGTCNFSRIDNAQLTGMGTSVDTVVAVNYNVLRIMSGMGGLAYSN